MTTPSQPEPLDTELDEVLSDFAFGIIKLNKEIDYDKKHHKFTAVHGTRAVVKSRLKQIIAAREQKYLDIALEFSTILDTHWNGHNVHSLPDSIIKKLSLVQQQLQKEVESDE